MSDFIRQYAVNIDYKSDESWVILNEIELSIKKKIEAIGIPLRDWDVTINYGVKTGLNKAFIINSEKRDEMIAEDPKSAEIIRPILRGRDIKKYSYTFSNLYVITAYKGINEIIEKDYPVVYNHLKKYEIKLRQRGQVEGKPGNPGSNQHHWTELDNNISLEKLDDFSKQKIVFSRISGDEPSFAMDYNGMLTNDTGYIITGSQLDYLLNQLTSPEIWFSFKKFYMGGGIEKEFKVNNLMNLRIPKIGTNLNLTTSEIDYIKSHS